MFTYAFLSWLDFIPEPLPASLATEEPLPEESVSDDMVSVEPEVVEESAPVPIERILPESITIDGLDRTMTVLNPNSREVADLDAALLYGVVRHPDSATLEQEGTVFILGHSSYLPNVLNKNFQAFNGIQNLRFGDLIRLEAGGVEYTYRVDRVYRAKAQDVMIPIAGTTKKLVLATCNSFGTVDDRYVVEADLFEIKTL